MQKVKLEHRKLPDNVDAGTLARALPLRYHRISSRPRAHAIAKAPLQRIRDIDGAKCSCWHTHFRHALPVVGNTTATFEASQVETVFIFEGSAGLLA
jgi:hypothetical protein